jgi:hypothetical protein
MVLDDSLPIASGDRDVPDASPIVPAFPSS